MSTWKINIHLNLKFMKDNQDTFIKFHIWYYYIQTALQKSWKNYYPPIIFCYQNTKGESISKKTLLIFLNINLIS